MQYGYVLLGCIIWLVAGVAHAQRDDMPRFVDRQVKAGCSRATPSLGTTNYPGFSSIMSSNKLAMPPGKSQLAEGQPVFFYGRVFDRNCVPVSEAKVELWHADPQGRFRFATPAALATPEAIFAGGGRTTTSNLGEFMFMTVYPGPYQYTITREGPNGETIKELIKRAPHFNVRITHDELPAYATTLYFENDRRNAEDHILKRYSDGVKERVLMDIAPREGDWNKGAQAFFDIVLPSRDPWRGF